MADRGIFRVVKRPPFRGEALSLLAGIRQVFKFSSGPTITGLNPAIASFDEGSEQRAFAMYAGEFQFGTQRIFSSPQVLFTAEHGDKAWQETLFSLSWLADFSSSKRQLHAHYALRLLGYWARVKSPHKNIIVLSKALIAISVHGAELALGADNLSQVDFLKIVAQTSVRCARLKPHSSAEALLQAIALLYASTAFQGLEALRKPASDILVTTLDHFILPDGGPASRQPDDLIEVLALLLPLQIAMKLNRQLFPPIAADALHRVFPFLAMLPHDDLHHSKKIGKLLKFDSDARPLRLAPYTGFARLTGAKTTLFADTKADMLFVFSFASQEFFRSTTNVQHLNAEAQLHDSDQGAALQVSTPDQMGRIYFLSAEGNDLRVEDSFTNPIQITFELAPQSKITTTREGGVIVIAPDQSVWHLTLRGGEAHVEENGAVLKICSIAEHKMNWALKKQTKTQKTAARKKLQEPDLLA